MSASELLYAQSLTSVLGLLRSRPLEAELPLIAPQKYAAEIPVFDDRGRTTMQPVRVDATLEQVLVYNHDQLLFQVALKLPSNHPSLFVQYVQRDALDILGISLQRAAIPLHYQAGGLTLDSALQQYEQQLVFGALGRTGGNKTNAAKLLGIKRTTLVEKLRHEGLLLSRASLQELSSQGTPSSEYNPDDLISEEWVAYQLGADPRIITEVEAIKTAIFGSGRLRPVVHAAGGRSLYRSGDFQERDFEPWGRSLRDVLSNPYCVPRKPDEELTEVDIARETGVSMVTVRYRLRRVKPLQWERRKGKRYLRGDVHHIAHLPGILQGDRT